MKYHQSLRKQIKTKNKNWSVNALKAKERKRLESPMPEMPIDREGDYQEVIIRGMYLGEYREITYVLLPAKNKGRCDQFRLLGAGSQDLGIMGADKAFTEIRKNEFVRIGGVN